ncbi:lysozyme inhibitor LprI family protein [Campylobacter concisus]|uniref:lysozyme inhibitor LprI family protein n=1 Tax=Campylobacter concisus TaxID=199 RepID=UPI000CD90C42|nr:lysozyme inhibitor LprI family protein [Campylobacter concisus]
MKSLKLIVISALLITSNLYSSEKIQPSFDCSKAKTRVEKLVCSDEVLSTLDRDMQKAYDLMMGKYDLAYMNEEAKEEIKPYLEKLKQSQIEWVKHRDRYCNTEKDKEEFRRCVLNEYYNRIQSVVPTYNVRIGFSINDKNSTNDLCYNYFTQKFWMDSPKPVNKDNPPYGEDKEFYEKFLIDALGKDIAERELNTTTNYYYTKLDFAPVGSYIMCVGIGGEEKEIYDLRSKTYKPYCVTLNGQFEDFLNGDYIRDGQKLKFGLKFKEIEEIEEEFKRRGLDYEKDDSFSTEVYKKTIKNDTDDFSSVIYSTDKSYDANILSDGMVRILYASNLHGKERKDKFGRYTYPDGYSSSPAFIVADKFFFRVYMEKYGNYLVCRMPIQSRFKDRNDSKLIREYLEQFKEF